MLDTFSVATTFQVLNEDPRIGWLLTTLAVALVGATYRRMVADLQKVVSRVNITDTKVDNFIAAVMILEAKMHPDQAEEIIAALQKVHLSSLQAFQGVENGKQIG